MLTRSKKFSNENNMFLEAICPNFQVLVYNVELQNKLQNSLQILIDTIFLITP